METVTTLVQDALPVMQFALNVRKRAILQKLAMERSKISKKKVSAAAWSPTLATVGAPESLSKSLGTVAIEGLEVKALFDSGSTESCIHPRLVEKAALTVHPSSGTVSMVTSVSSTLSITDTYAANRDFKIGHYGRLGRWDRCHATQNTRDLLPSSF